MISKHTLFCLILVLFVSSVEITIPSQNQSLSFLTPTCLKYNTSFSWVEGNVVFQKFQPNASLYGGKIVFIESPIFSAPLINIWVENRPIALVYIFVASPLYNAPGDDCVLYNTGQIYANNVIFASIILADYTTLLNHVDNTTVVTANFTNGETNVFVDKLKYFWIIQLILCIFLVLVIAAAAHRIYIIYRKAKQITLSISYFILFEICGISILETIYVAIDPNYTYGILDSRLGVGWLNVGYPFAVNNVFLIALYWEELLQKSTKVVSFLLKYSKVFIGFCIFIFAINLGMLVSITLIQDFTIFANMVTAYYVVSIIIAGISFIYCIINSIRILILVSKFSNNDNLINNRTRKKKLDYIRQ